MPQAIVENVTLEYQTFGNPEHPALLLVMGLGAQMLQWDDAFCQAFAEEQLFVIRFDNRDVGLSTRIPTDIDIQSAILSVLMGENIEVPYTLADMARDAVGVLDALQIEKAHVMGASMGGMISQQMAIDFPERMHSLTSLMSTTGDPDVGQPDPEVASALLQPPPQDRSAAIAHMVRVAELIGTPNREDMERVHQIMEESYDRCSDVSGMPRQLLAILSSGSRSKDLGNITIPTLVLHGDADPLIHISGGHRTAEVVSDSKFVVLPGMGHDRPQAYWSDIISAVTDHIS